MDYSILMQQVLSDVKQNALIPYNVIQKKIKNGKVDYNDATIFSKALGRATSDGLLNNMVEIEDLDGYATQVVAPVYRSMQKTMLSTTKQVQKMINRRENIGLNPADTYPDESRIQHITERFKDATELPDVSFLLERGVAENIARGAVIDSIRSNAEQHERAGLETYVIRTGAGCCAWCDSVLGRYALDDVPDGFWRVHKGCTCQIEYKSERTHSMIRYEGNRKVTENA